MRFLGIHGNLCLSFLISLIAISLSACLSETANSREQSSLKGTELMWFLWLLSDPGLCWWEMEKQVDDFGSAEQSQCPSVIPHTSTYFSAGRAL